MRDDDIDCIINTRSLSLEYLSLQKLRETYEAFISSFPSTFKQDRDELARGQGKLSGRETFAITYRMETKRILDQ